MSQYYDAEIVKKASVILEELDDEEKDSKRKPHEAENPEGLEEGLVKDIASGVGRVAGAVGKAAVTTATDTITGLAGGLAKGILGPKEERLMKNAVQTFEQALDEMGVVKKSGEVEKQLANVLQKFVVRNQKLKMKK